VCDGGVIAVRGEAQVLNALIWEGQSVDEAGYLEEERKTR